MIRATPAHAEALAALHAAAFPPKGRWSAATMALQLGLPGVFGWIAAEGGMVLARVAADEAEVLTLAVAPAARRAGLGRRLLLAAMAEAGRSGARAVFLEVAATNAAAIALYGSAGFAQVGSRRRYYADGADALVLQAIISCESRSG